MKDQKRAGPEKRAKKTRGILVKVVFTRYYRYDLGGGGLPFGHDYDDAASLKFPKGKRVWWIRYKAVNLHKFVYAYGKPIGEQQPLPWSKYYSGESYKQAYFFPKEFTAPVVERFISLAVR